MRLAQLMRGVQVEEVLGPGRRPVALAALGDLAINRVCEDSRQVEAGDLFVAVPGQTVDGHRFLADAVARGAAAVVVERLETEVGVPALRVPSAAQALSLLAQNAHGRPADELTLIGVTGTNGKTTTCFLIESLLRQAGYEPGLLGTILYRYKDHALPAPLTTPGSLYLNQTLRAMRDDGVDAVAMEVSSHALALRRLHGVRFRVAAFSNLTQDHLDFHGDMERYFAAKATLFSAHLLPGIGIAVVNIDNDHGRRIAALVPRANLLTVSIQGDADISLVQDRMSIAGIAATLRTPAGEVRIDSPLIGRYNLDNLALAAGIGVALGLSAEVTAAGLSALRGVPGRLERVDGPRDRAEEEAPGPAVFVDYAHTPDALRRVLAALRPLVGRVDGQEPGRLVVVFGCGGDRDRGKRPQMGQVAAQDADLLVVTSDNPRTESPAAIIDMILEGVGSEQAPLLSRAEFGSARRGHLVEPDRRLAIRTAVLGALSGDVVLIAGKGHEDYQVIGTGRQHFDDREEASEALRQRSQFLRPASIELPIERVLQATQGHLLRGVARRFSNVVIDGRAATPGALFVAVRGARHDGHDFAGQAIERGATGVLVERGRGAALAGLAPDTTVIEVGDTIVALGQIARAHRDAPEQARGLKVVALTGSTGKTTTKEMMAAILSAHAPGEVLKTEGNLNNHLGVPLTLLRLRPGHRYAVIELGMSARGEIAYLTSLCRPDVGIVTNVGPVHLESLGTVEEVARAKGELFLGLADGCAAVYPSGPAHALIEQQARYAGACSGRLRGLRASAGPQPGPEAAAHAEVLEEDTGGLCLRLTVRPAAASRAEEEGGSGPATPPEVLSVRMPLLGAHNAENAALAAAAALALDLPRAAITAGLAAVQPGKHRTELLELARRRILDDCYNASPMSVRAALQTAKALRGTGRVLLLLGDMLELGPEEAAFHRQIGAAAAETGVDLLLAVGERAQHAARAAAERGVRAVTADSIATAARVAAEESRPGDLLLLKGSRGMQLERVLELLPAHFEGRG